MAIQVHLAVSTNMMRSVLRSALVEDDDIALTGDAQDATVDVIVLDKDCGTGCAICARMAEDSSVGIVAVDAAGEVTTLYRLWKRRLERREAGRRGLSGAIREAAR